ncbi:hypothetical protein PISL3812_01144 [Talaromyces islandicus]|uniref:Uncharacterized protein n=1 Tax=Talaromyces islandicus TaxID=28573 RepID=A0A0U1LLB0_TALIS|nr:hypothetical protein PISL3812_01144 [Talaromyces islandicus]
MFLTVPNMASEPRKCNNFPFPKIVRDPSLIFSPYVSLFGILFYLDAFEVESLYSMEDVRRIFVEDG